MMSRFVRCRSGRTRRFRQRTRAPSWPRYPSGSAKPPRSPSASSGLRILRSPSRRPSSGPRGDESRRCCSPWRRARRPGLALSSGPAPSGRLSACPCACRSRWARRRRAHGGRAGASAALHAHEVASDVLEDLREVARDPAFLVGYPHLMPSPGLTEQPAPRWLRTS